MHGGPQAENSRRVAGGRVGSGQGAAQGAHGPHHRIPDAASQLRQGRQMLAHQRRDRDIGMAHHGADREPGLIAGHAFETGDRPKIYEPLRSRHPELHRLHQALPAGQVAAVALVGRQGLALGQGEVVFEWVHGV